MILLTILIQIAEIVKKIPADVDNLTDNEIKRFKLLTSIKQMIAEGFRYADIANTLGISIRTVVRHKDCNPIQDCHVERPSRKNEVQKYKPEIIRLIKSGYHASGIAKELIEGGCPLGKSTLRRYATKYSQELSDLINKGKKGPELQKRNEIDESNRKTILIKKPDLIRLLWSKNRGFDSNRSLIYKQYPAIFELKKCIDDFRQIFQQKRMALLYLFIERYKKSHYSSISSFAKGLERDIDAIENAVASPLSNGFVEGSNSRTKMVKRSMYGRCGLELLSAKIMLPYA